MLIHDLDTPAVVCDLDKLERNIQAMANHCRQLHIPFRSHTRGEAKLSKQEVTVQGQILKNSKEHLMFFSCYSN